MRGLGWSCGPALALLLVACAGNPAKPAPEPLPWAAQGACSGTIAALPRTALQPSKSALWRGEFRDAASCLRNSDGPEPAMLIALDESLAQQDLDLVLHIGKQFLLGAAVQVLDADLRPISAFGFDDFTARGSMFSLRLFAPAEGLVPAYLLIRVDPDARGTDFDRISGQRMTTVWMAGPYMGSVSDGTESRQRVAVRDTGMLSLHRVAADAPPSPADQGRR